MILVQNHQQRLSGSNRCEATIRVTVLRKPQEPWRASGTVERRGTVLREPQEPTKASGSDESLRNRGEKG
jgi:hypothetical protein